MIKSFSDLAAKTREKINGRPPRMGVIYPRGGKCLEAVTKAAADGFTEPVMFGPAVELENNASLNKIDLGSIKIVNVTSPDEAARKAFDAVATGDLHFQNGNPPRVRLRKDGFELFIIMIQIVELGTSDQHRPAGQVTAVKIWHGEGDAVGAD